jgi:hypothetical protein
MFRRTLERVALGTTVAAVLGHYLWTVSSNGRAFDFDPHSVEYYNRLSEALLEGRLSLRPDPDPALLALPNPYGAANQRFRVANLTQDLSLYGGRYYLYFGVAPALALFIPVRVLTAHALPQSLAAALLLFGAVGWSVAAFLLLQRQFQPDTPFLLRWLSIVALGFGNFGPFVLRRPVVYEVATTAAAFFQAAAVFWLVKTAVAARFSTIPLAAAGACVALAIGSRPTQVLILGPLAIAILLLGLHRPENRRAFMALAAPIVLGLLGLAAYNHARFGVPWEFGIRYELSDWDIRRIRLLSPAYVPFNVVSSLLKPPRLDPEFPFFHVTPALPPRPPAGYMFVETQAGLLACMPFAALAFVWPFLLRGTEPDTEARRLTVIGTLLTVTGLTVGLGVSAFAVTSIRFTLDFSMPLLLSAALACAYLDGALSGRRPARVAFGCLCVAAVAYGTAVNVAIGLTGLYDWLRRGEPNTYARIESFFAPLQRVALAAHPRHYGDARLTVRLHPPESGKWEVLVAAGALYRHDVLCLRYLDGDRVAFRFEQRGFEPIRSRPVAAATDVPHTLEVAMGSFFPLSRRAIARLYPATAAQGVDRRLSVRLDGEEVLVGEFDFVPSPPDAVLFGRDEWGNGTCVTPFSGEIISVHRSFPP